MNWKDFDMIARETLGASQKIMDAKAVGYADIKDRLSNFKRGGQLLDMRPIRYAMALMTKHVIALYDMVERERTIDISPGNLDEKLCDIINYLILIKALTKEPGEEFMGPPKIGQPPVGIPVRETQ